MNAWHRLIIGLPWLHLASEETPQNIERPLSQWPLLFIFILSQHIR